MITSMDNARVKHLVRLAEKTKYRRECGLYIAEGPRMAREVPKDLLEEVYLLKRFEETHPDEAKKIRQKALSSGAGCEVLSEAVYAKVSGTVTPQGVICVVRQRQDTLAEALLKPGLKSFLVLENIQDPGNLGTMIRTGEGAGITGIIADGATVDVYNPKVVRGTMGSVFRVPYIAVGDAADAVRALKEKGVKTAAMLPAAEVDYTDADFTGDIAFLIGNEGNGLSAALSEAADQKIRIPMEGQVESLNAAVAAALCMYEAKRQRTRKTGQLRRSF